MYCMGYSLQKGFVLYKHPCQHGQLSDLVSDSVRTCQGEEDGDTRHSITVVGEGERGTREYNTSSGAMILVSRKNKQYYTWVSQRQPRKVKAKVNAKTNTRSKEKRKRNKKQREKKKKGANSESPRTSAVQPVTDPALPVVRIMFANQVICSGAVIHPQYVLTSAHCVANMTGLYILQEDNLVSLYQVYIYSQHDSHALALIQTLTHLPVRQICFQGLGKNIGDTLVTSDDSDGIVGLGLNRREMLVGYKKNSKRKDQMVYSRVNINLRNHSRAVIQNVELGKWVEGGVILEKIGTKGYSVTGIVSSTSKCENRQPEVRMISDEILGWISAVITQDTPIIPVS